MPNGSAQLVDSLSGRTALRMARYARSDEHPTAPIPPALPRRVVVAASKQTSSSTCERRTAPSAFILSSFANLVRPPLLDRTPHHGYPENSRRRRPTPPNHVGRISAPDEDKSDGPQHTVLSPQRAQLRAPLNATELGAPLSSRPAETGHARLCPRGRAAWRRWWWCGPAEPRVRARGCAPGLEAGRSSDHEHQSGFRYDPEVLSRSKERG